MTLFSVSKAGKNNALTMPERIIDTARPVDGISKMKGETLLGLSNLPR